MNSRKSSNELDSVISANSFSDVTNDLTALSISEESDTVIIANRSPDEAIDLTTLSGRKNKYKKMVETLFRSDFGNVKLGDILLTSKDEFLNEYGKSPQTRSLLRGWIEEYNLGDRFSKVESGESISTFAGALMKSFQLEILTLSFYLFLISAPRGGPRRPLGGPSAAPAGRRRRRRRTNFPGGSNPP